MFICSRCLFLLCKSLKSNLLVLASTYAFRGSRGSVVRAIIFFAAVGTAACFSPTSNSVHHFGANVKHHAVPKEQMTFEAENPGLFETTRLKDVIVLVDELRQEKARLVNRVVKLNEMIQNLQSSPEDEISQVLDRYKDVDSTNVVAARPETQDAIAKFFRTAVNAVGGSKMTSPGDEVTYRSHKKVCYIYRYNYSTS